jgi:hypothetical protein
MHFRFASSWCAPPVRVILERQLGWSATPQGSESWRVALSSPATAVQHLPWLIAPPMVA